MQCQQMTLATNRRVKMTTKEPTTEQDLAIQKKFEQFHELKKNGKNYNDSLFANKSFRNPTLYKKLVNFVDVDEIGSNLVKEGYDPHAFEKSSYASALASQQSKMESMRKNERLSGKRNKIDFTSGRG